jgi:phospholipid transport system substrate-binding protein
MRLFDEAIIRNLSARFGEYQGVRFSLGRSQQRTEEDALVTTIIERPGNAPFALDWRVGDVGGQPKVVDVIAEGTSLRLTTRSEYAAVIQRNGGQVSALLTALRTQIQQLAAQEQRT